MRQVLQVYWPTVRLHWRSGLVTVLFLVIVQGLGVLPQFFMRQFVDLIASGTGDVRYASILLGQLAAVSFTTMFAWYAYDVSIVTFETRTMRHVDRRTFRMLMRQSLRFFEDQKAGALVKQGSELRESLESITDQLCFFLVRDVILCGFILTIFCLQAPALAVLFGAWLVAFVVANVFLARWQFRSRTRVAEAESDVSAYLADAVANVLPIKTFGREEEEVVRFDQCVEECHRKRFRGWNITNKTHLIRSALIRSCELTSLTWLIYEWAHGRMTPGNFVFFQGYVVWISNNMREFGNALSNMISALADAKPMASIYQLQPEVQDAPDAYPLQVTQGEMRFKRVRFSYERDPVKAANNGTIHDLDLVVRPGQRVAIVGPSGSGKSTLMRLGLRAMDLTDGSIEIDGQAICDVTQQSLHRAIAYVPQDPALFHRSILDNILTARPTASMEEVVIAAERAHAMEFIRRLPNGFQTLVGERGVKLSGGERQRIAIARALLSNAPIIFLDEATSALDSGTEQLIQLALAELFRGRTSIVIAHRLSTIKDSDLIVVLKNGRIVERGTHAELLALGGIYADLWAHQTNGFMPE